MLKNRIYTWIIILIALSLVSACAPKPQPVGTAPPAPVAPAKATVPTSNLPPPTSQDTAWSGVVEAAKKEGRLVIYGATPFANAGREIMATFSARYGIPVDLLLLGGRQQVEKLKVERSIKQPIADIIQTGVTSATEIVLDGLSESAVRTLPVLRDRSLFYVDPVYGPQEQIIGFSMTLLGPLVNTNLVKPDDIKSWRDILDPKWKGRITMSDPRSTGTGLNLFSTLTYHKVLDYDYFRRLAQQDVRLSGASNRETYTQVARGEYAIDFAAGQNTIAPFIMEGAPLKVLAPEEGNTSQLEPVMLAKDPPHPNAARVFINWLLSQEGQEAYNKTVSSQPLRKDMPDFSPEKVKVNPKKIWNRTWEAAEQSNKDLKSGITVEIFGKK